MEQVNVGLFGTAGNRTDENFCKWREPIIAALEKMKLTAFDPVVPEGRCWDGEAELLESFHFRTCKVLAFHVTTTTKGLGAVAEIGFGVAEAILSGRPVVIYLELFTDEQAEKLGETRKELNRPRLLVINRADDLIRKHLEISEQVVITESFLDFQQAILDLAWDAKEFGVGE